MANMRCTVKFFLDQVTCPGTLHLPDRNPVSVSIFLFGRFQSSPNVYPSFPMCLSTKIKFRRLFTNARTPEQVLEILEDETILIELRQHTEGVKGGRVLAEFQESTRSFLFPSRSYIPKKNHLKRDVLLTRTDLFPIGKGLDPQLFFHTKTYIEEGPFMHLTAGNMSVSKQIPASQVSLDNDKRKKKKSPPMLCDVDINEHCICDCPTLEENPAVLEYWFENQNKGKKENNDQPFRTGKAPIQLLSKREFADVRKKQKKIRRKGICEHCVVPLPSCVLCTAYKTVYGPTYFLTHRFKKKNRTKRRSSKRDSSDPRTPEKVKFTGQSYDSAKYDNSTEIEKVDESVLKTDGNIRPVKVKSNRNYSVSNHSGDDSDLFNDIEDTPLPPRSSPIASPLLMDERSRSLSPNRSTFRSKLFSHAVSCTQSDEEPCAMKSEYVHQRIKRLMKKNNSALQYDLSSSESITDDEDNIYEEWQSLDSSPEDSPTYASPRRNVPAKSVVEPLASQTKWSDKSGDINGFTHRDKLDSRLKSIYADLYQRTLNNS